MKLVGVIFIAFLTVEVLETSAAETRVINCGLDDAACLLVQQTPSSGSSVTVQGSIQAAQIPVVRLEKPLRQPAISDWQLGVSRLVLLNVELSSPLGATRPNSTIPFMWPINAFGSVGSGLELQDVRLVAKSSAVFREYLDFFMSQPILAGSNNANFHTDGRTFLHIGSWAVGSTVMSSVTVMTGPCAAEFEQQLALGRSLALALMWDNSTSDSMGSSGAVALVSGGSSSGNGCNVFTANNRSVVPLLLDQGTISTREKLLVLLQSNVSLGKPPAGVQSGRIKLGRPVALAGLKSVPTGVNLEMHVNQLDVTAPLARISLSGLILENLATGDITTTLVSAPFSPVASVNLWAVFCSRARVSKPCTVLENVTLVIGSQTEMDYIGYMYSMFNSQAPGARQLTLFYAQDLLFTSLNFTVGPGPDSITVHNATSVSWRMLNVIYTTRPAIFPLQPFPVRTYVDFEAAKAAPLALQIRNCADLRDALEYRTIPSRLHMLLMRASFSLAPSNTRQVSSIELPPTQGLPKAVDGPSSYNITVWPDPEPAPTCLGPRPLVAYRTQIQGLLTDDPIVISMPEVSSNGSMAHVGFPTLGLAYTRNALVLPSDQPGQLTFQNLLLEELPQGGTPDELLATAKLPHQLPPEAWTLLLWSINSTLTHRALRVRNSAMKLPEPEYRHLAVLAKLSKAFIVELAGHPDALTFKDTTEHTTHLHVGWYEGPGLMGENVTFILDTDAQHTLTRLSTYWWPAAYQPLVDGQQLWEGQGRSGPPVALVLPAVLVPVVVVLVLVAVLGGLALRRWHRQKIVELRIEAGLSSPNSQASDKPFDGLVREPGNSGSHSNISSSHRSSREGLTRHAHSSSAASTSDTSVRLDVEQLTHAGMLGLGGGSLLHEHRSGLPSPSSTAAAAAAAAAGHPGSPTADHRVRFYGVFPVFEGKPVDDVAGSMVSAGQLVPQPVGTRCASSSSNSSPGTTHSSRAGELAQVHSSTPNSLHMRQQHALQHHPDSAAAGAGQRAALCTPLPSAGATPAPAAAAAASGSAVGLASTVASGLERWKSVISSTTLQLAERRLAGQAASAMTVGGLQTATAPELAQSQPHTAAAPSFSSGWCQVSTAAAQAAAALEPAPQQQQQQQQSLSPPGPNGQPAGAVGAAAAAATAAAASAAPSTSANALQQGSSSSSGALVLKRVLGRGSFGQVWLGVWRGIPVAVKIMHLPTSLLADHQDEAEGQQQQQQEVTPPHFAVMEAVLSSQCSHPHVVQVYTYMLTPLLTAVKDSGLYDSGADGSGGPAAAGDLDSRQLTVVGEPGLGASAADLAAAAAAAAAACAASGAATLSGWELKLIMELCDEGTLRTALDKGMFMQAGASFIHPSLALLLARDVAAAMLHLHSEGVVHGDLKAANVMLATGGPDPDGAWAATLGRRLVAKVADFGLAVSLGPSETHASLSARGTPTHMSPELFMAGRVSKACDTYAYGMLLYEIITGQRAFSGVPLPLLPHEVAVKGLRPQWPPELPRAFVQLQQLAEACWRQAPEDRPAFAQVLDALDHWADGDDTYRPAWLGCAPAQQPSPTQLTHWKQQPQQQQQQQRRVEVVLDQPVGQELQHRQQAQRQQQLRQWRLQQPVEQDSTPPVDVAPAAAEQKLLPPRAGKMDWSEVSFEVLQQTPAAGPRPPPTQRPPS